MIILGNIVIMLIYCNMFRSGQYGKNRMSYFAIVMFIVFSINSSYFTK